MSAKAALLTPELSERETKVLELTAEGRTNHEIAHRLGLSVEAIGRIRKRARAKERMVVLRCLDDLNERVKWLEAQQKLHSVGHLAGKVAREARALREDLAEMVE